MADWNDPILTSLYSDFLSELKARDSDLAKMFDSGTPTNVETGSIRWNSTASRWEKWSGAAWAELDSLYEISVTKLNGVTGSGYVLIAHAGAGGAVHANVVAAGAAGFITGADKTKLDGIESSATADQTDGEIKTAYEANADTNEFSDAEQTKLSGIATGAEVNIAQSSKAAIEARTNENTYSPPDLLQYAPGSAKLYINFNGTGTIAIRRSYNVTSITDNGTGDYTVTISTDMSGADYAVVFGVNGTHLDGTNSYLPKINGTSGLLAGSFRFKCLVDSGAANDVLVITAAVFGDQV